MVSTDLDIPALPFYWRLRRHDGAIPNPVPDLLPFAFDFDPALMGEVRTLPDGSVETVYNFVLEAV